MKFKKDALPVDFKERLKYLYRFQEMLMLFHNKKGGDFRDGKMTEVDFKRFQKGWIKERNQLICREINKCRENISEFEKVKKLSMDEQYDAGAKYKLAKNDETIHIDITDIEEE